MISERWQKLLRRPGTLPALPEVLVRLRVGLYDLDVDIDGLCEELQRDPALVTEILKWINSPLFGVRRRIESLKQAVVLLGLRRVRAIILSQSLRQSLATYESPGFSLFNWWDRSFLNAVAAASLCQRAAPDMAEEAYLAGLVVGVGILVLARFEPSYEKLLHEHEGKASEDLWLAEPDVMDIDHATLGAGIFDCWKFPGNVVEAARRHHDLTLFEDGPASILPRVVYFASLLTDCVVTERDDLCERLGGIAGDHFFMSRRELSDFTAACLERYRSVAAVLGHGALANRNVPPALARSA